MYQRIVVIGNLGKDPELRYTEKGQAMVRFSVATNETWVDPDGHKQERTIWWRISVFGKQAENCNVHLQKGSMVLVDGRLTCDPSTGGPRLWTGQDGIIRTSFELWAREVRFLGGRNGMDEGHAGQVSSERDAPSNSEEVSL
jgi:single-strand DNA-binding protein